MIWGYFIGLIFEWMVWTRIWTSSDVERLSYILWIKINKWINVKFCHDIKAQYVALRKCGCHKDIKSLSVVQHEWLINVVMHSYPLVNPQLSAAGVWRLRQAGLQMGEALAKSSLSPYLFAAVGQQPHVNTKKWSTEMKRPEHMILRQRNLKIAQFTPTCELMYQLLINF